MKGMLELRRKGGIGRESRRQQDRHQGQVRTAKSGEIQTGLVGSLNLNLQTRH